MTDQFVHNNKPVHEFGYAVTSSILVDDGALAKQLLEKNAEILKGVLSYITDMEFIGDLEWVDGPADPLGRFKNTGYRFKTASLGYRQLSKHFECRHTHVPETITLEFISQMIERYGEQQKYLEEDDE